MRNRDRAIGAYIGAAIGDAMGGPVECSHAARIKRLVGEVTGLLEYTRPPRLIDPKPGYALRTDAGSVTDDTFIRGDFTRFLVETAPLRTPALLVEWMLAHADFSMWWPPAVEGLRRVQRGEVTPEEAGDSYGQGGGIAWWTPVGILYGGQPERAAAVSRDLCRIWKAPLERDFCAAVQAAVAEGVREGATMDSMLEAYFTQCGPLATKLTERALDIAQRSGSLDELIDGLYATCLMPPLSDREHEPPRAADGPMPPIVEPLADSDTPYLTCFYAEQIPISVAAFVFGKGEPGAIGVCASIGRDADSTATTVGSWVGALHGESGLPAEWVETVCRVNMGEIDIRGLAERLVALEA